MTHTEIDLTFINDRAVIKNPINDNRIEVFRETYAPYAPGEPPYTEYIVCFSTQHRHMEDPDEVKDYIRGIMRDEIFAIDFYPGGAPHFGGEITREEFDRLSPESAAERFGFSPAYIRQFDCRITSWSGEYDRKIKGQR